ncbi:hypothetical protein FQP90_06625 [Paenarthrobacter nitroguajacolicus]|uniref:Uncharacterized protein n=1 Tax=Paenarthrobacter nitroguajacolicus TaxID=211146 RepID=A0A558H6I7_PAENT|nr:hypothetical protein [Paenarthrobacter nitroguajacolicus]TVU64733.1 hypothetical protein FQP90_06625 [Paenarthrobacter nitroguajacolicus]
MQNYFLTIGVTTESITSRIKVSGAGYVAKRLTSSPANWDKIITILGDGELSGAVVTLNRRNYEQLVSEQFSRVSVPLILALAKARSLVMVHEAVYGGASLLAASNEGEEWDGYTWNDQAALDHFGEMDETLRLRVNDLLQSNGISPRVYKRNAELSNIAVSYIDDRLHNLLFRLYLPSGRLFEEETAQLLTLFQEWLMSVRHQRVRQSGYQTDSGRVVEFFSEDGVSAETWGSEIRRFSEFVATIENQDAAACMLVELGLTNSQAENLVSRYAKRLRRLQLDAKHERQRRILSIRQELESELGDHESEPDLESVAQLVEQLVPTSPGREGFDSLELVRSPAQQIVNIHNQYFNHVEGVVAQHVNGNVVLPHQAEDLLRLVKKFGADGSDELVAATHELADKNAPQTMRLNARQKLKAFLVSAAQKTSDAGISIAQAWVEQQLGL